MPPEQVVDVQALAGDSIDNVPGVPGIGVKTAAKLIAEFGDLETLLARADEVKQPKCRERLVEFADQARVRPRARAAARGRARRDRAAAARRARSAAALLAFLRAMEFSTSQAHRREARARATAPQPSQPPRPRPAARAAAPRPVSRRHAGIGSPAAVRPSCPPTCARSRSIAGYEIVTAPERLAEWVAAAREQGRFGFDTETTGLDAMRADLVGFSLAVVPNKACYVPLAHRGGAGDLFGGGELPGRCRCPSTRPDEAAGAPRRSRSANIKFATSSWRATASASRPSTIRCCSPTRSTAGVDARPRRARRAPPRPRLHPLRQGDGARARPEGGQELRHGADRQGGRVRRRGRRHGAAALAGAEAASRRRA